MTEPVDEPLPQEPPQTGFWSGETILLRQRLADKPIIERFDKKYLDAASYLLSVGPEIYVTPAGEKDALTRTRHLLKAGESYPIPPGQFALLTTRETVNVPTHAIGFISMRSRYKFRGLINVSGFYVDPGYSGKLIFAVFNSGPATVHVTEGERWFSVFFADLDRPKTEQYRKDKENHDGIRSDMISAISAEFLTLNGLDGKIKAAEEALDKRLQAVERENAVVRWAAALVLAFLLAFAARSCLPTPPPDRLVNGQVVVTP